MKRALVENARQAGNKLKEMHKNDGYYEAIGNKSWQARVDRYGLDEVRRQMSEARKAGVAKQRAKKAKYAARHARRVAAKTPKKSGVIKTLDNFFKGKIGA